MSANIITVKENEAQSRLDNLCSHFLDQFKFRARKFLENAGWTTEEACTYIQNYEADNWNKNPSSKLAVADPDCKSPAKKKLKSATPQKKTLPKKELQRLHGLKKPEIMNELHEMGEEYSSKQTKGDLLAQLIETKEGLLNPAAQTQKPNTEIFNNPNHPEVEVLSKRLQSAKVSSGTKSSMSVDCPSVQIASPLPTHSPAKSPAISVQDVTMLSDKKQSPVRSPLRNKQNDQYSKMHVSPKLAHSPKKSVDDVEMKDASEAKKAPESQAPNDTPFETPGMFPILQPPKKESQPAKNFVNESQDALPLNFQTQSEQENSQTVAALISANTPAKTDSTTLSASAYKTEKNSPPILKGHVSSTKKIYENHIKHSSKPEPKKLGFMEPIETNETTKSMGLSSGTDPAFSTSAAGIQAKINALKEKKAAKIRPDNGNAAKLVVKKNTNILAKFGQPAVGQKTAKDRDREIREEYKQNNPTAAAGKPKPKPKAMVGRKKHLTSKKSAISREPICEPSYEITDDENSDTESECSRRREEKIKPSWASKSELTKAIKVQLRPDYPIDPDELFGEVETCNLEDVFWPGERFRKPRNSTGNWKQLSDEEKQAYKLKVQAQKAAYVASTLYS